jgi:phosphocarrier protein
LGKFESKVEIQRDDLLVDGKSIMGIMMLAAEQGAKLIFRIDGADEKDAMDAVEELFEKRFYEE